MADPVNPYLPSGLDKLSTMLMALGSGISGAESRGQSGWAGIGPAAAMYGAANAQANQQATQYGQWQQQYQQQEAYRKAQEDALKAQTEQRQQELDITKKLMGGMGGLLGGGDPAPLGMGMSAPQPTMGPGGGYFATTGAAETGGSPSPYTQPNKMGSGAYGKYQFMPDTWASIAPSLGLPFNIRQSTPDQQEQAMRALTQRNAQALGTSDPAALYLAHRFGAAGAKTVLSADPSTPIASLFPPNWAQQNPDMQGATVGQFRQNARQMFSGNPQIQPAQAGPQQGGATVQPPRVDPMKFLPYTLSKTLQPFGAAGISIGNAETDRYMKDQDRQQKEQQFRQEQALREQAQGATERNQKVGPNGINNPLIEAETEAAKRRAEAESGVKLETEAALKLSADEMTRYSKEVRPQVEGAANSLPNLYEMKRLASGPIAAGPFMDTRMLAARTADWLGLSSISDPMVNRTEFNNRAAKNVLAILQTKALGSGTGISSTDREFVEKMAGSGGTFSQPELKRLIDIGIQSQKQIIDQHGQTVTRMGKLPGVGKLNPEYFKIDAPSYDEWAKGNPPLGATPSPAGNPLDEEMKRRGLLGKTPTPVQGSNPLDDEMRRRGLR